MMHNQIKYSFDNYLNSLNKCYSEEVQHLLPNINDFPNAIINAFEKKEFSTILEFGRNQSDQFMTSVCNRIVGIHNIQISRRNKTELDVNKTFKLISASITGIPSNSTISSVGSQGFLSIPLFKFEEEIRNLEFIRFHIWSPKLEKYIDPRTRDLFSIHSHRFHAQSWIITGELVNQDYKVNRKSENANSALFEIIYNETLNNVNQHQSTARNSGKYIEVKELRKSIFTKNDTYEIQQGEFHKSSQKNDLMTSATFFSFYLNNEQLGQSEVTGPIDITESKINRKMYIEPREFLREIEESIDAE
ncbi:hypothetical protein [Ulvibacterium sp.]|uniref:hypothetical protein n=1 Tax=Ulvibacterium sp. TaxID=2665914 RepID=UPI0026074E06|nr:hypothetical protein [Ulvibacterium sp.]